MSETKRVKLTVKGVEQIQSFGDSGQKLPFSAMGEDGKELMYLTYNKRLFDHIKPNQTIDVDVETAQRETKSGTFIDRKVTQIYEDGKAISAERKAFSGGYRKSPEELKQEWELKQQERQSIEAQTAVKVFAQVATTSTVPIPEDVVTAAWAWVRARITTTTALKAPRFEDAEAKVLTVEPAVVSAKEIGEQAQLIKQVKSALLAAGHYEKEWFAGHPQFILKPWGQQGVKELQAILLRIAKEEHVRQDFKKIGCTEKDWLSGHNYGFANLKDATEMQIAKITTTIKTEYADLEENTTSQD